MRGRALAHGDAGLGVGDGLLDVSERHSGVEGRGDERVPQGVRPDGFGDPGAAGHPRTM
jgi:hypothetical protein